MNNWIGVIVVLCIGSSVCAVIWHGIKLEQQKRKQILDDVKATKRAIKLTSKASIDYANYIQQIKEIQKIPLEQRTKRQKELLDEYLSWKRL